MAMQDSLKSLMDWVDARLPVTETWEKHASKYYAPKNFNFWYYFGILSAVVLANQLLTGLWLTMSLMNGLARLHGALAKVMLS